jgi:glucose/arabinose dehydrogenase
MNRTLRLGLGLIVILSFVALLQITTTASYSQDPQKQPAPEKKQPAPEQKQPAPEQKQPAPENTITINGTISAIDASAVTVVDDQKASHKIAIDTNTKISKAGKDATVADVKADDAVVVEARKGEGDALTAITIKVS